MRSPWGLSCQSNAILALNYTQLHRQFLTVQRKTRPVAIQNIYCEEQFSGHQKSILEHQCKEILNTQHNGKYSIRLYIVMLKLMLWLRSLCQCNKEKTEQLHYKYFIKLRLNVQDVQQRARDFFQYVIIIPWRVNVWTLFLTNQTQIWNLLISEIHAWQILSNSHAELI